MQYYLQYNVVIWLIAIHKMKLYNIFVSLPQVNRPTISALVMPIQSSRLHKKSLSVLKLSQDQMNSTYLS